MVLISMISVFWWLGGEINIVRFCDWEDLGAIRLIVEIKLPFIFIRDITLPALQITAS